MVGQTHRTVKTAAKLRNRLQPRLGRNLEPIENRLQALGYHTTGPGSQLTTRPVQQLQIALKKRRGHPLSTPWRLAWVKDCNACPFFPVLLGVDLDLVLQTVCGHYGVDRFELARRGSRSLARAALAFLAR